jgi:phosphoserine phosphatase
MKLTDFKLAAFDMDSTLINIECVDEIADAAGRKTEVAAITEAAMRGDITDFKESLRRRLTLLKGVSESALEAVYNQRLQINPGVERTVAAFKAVGIKLLLVSGGFTFFSDRVAQRLGFDFSRANVLELEGGCLTGRLVEQPWGEIVDGEEKKRTVLAIAAQLGLAAHQVMVIGDGANDLPMMSVAGLSVAYHAKPKVREQAMVQINTGGMDELLKVFSDSVPSRQ